jgi:septum formation inhibitor-activating ATPase MinD
VSSLKTYTSILKNLYKRCFGTGDIETDKFSECEKVLEQLKDLEPSKRKSILSALVVITDKKPYRDEMLSDIAKYNTIMDTHDKSDKEKDSWLNQDDITSVLNKLKEEATFLYKKKTLSMSDLQQIQNYIIICILGGVYVPPRRSTDFCLMKIRNYSKEEDNYFEKNQMVFNKYKTAKTYKQQTLTVPPELKSILTKWIKVIPDTVDFLLFDNNGSQLTNVKMTQRLNKIFGKKSSINSLRHSYLTTKFGSQIEIQKEMDAVSHDMGTSSSTVQNIYLKK